jgi:hypothetical protein
MTKALHEHVDALSGIDNPDAAFDAAFSLVAYTVNRHLVDHMLRGSRLLTGSDYEAMVILAVVAHQNVAHLMPPGSVPTAVLNENGRLPDGPARMRPLRLRDVAAITGIPRETARRKLAWLESRQFVEKTAEGWMVSAARAEPELREFTRETTWRLLLTAEQVLRQLRDAARGP